MSTIQRATFEEPTRQTLTALYSAGAAAYASGTPYHANPNIMGECHHFLVSTWDNGWVDAAKEDGYVWNSRKDGVEKKAV